MPWTDIPDKGIGDLMDETWYDDHFKGNMEWLKNTLGPVTPELTNNSGSAVDTGAVVVLDTSADKSFTTSTTEGDPSVIGVAMENIASAASGRIGCAGLAQVTVDGTVSRGDTLMHSDATGVAKAGNAGVFAIALTTNASGTGLVWAQLIPVPQKAISVSAYVDTVSVAAGWNLISFTTNKHDTAGMHTAPSAQFNIPMPGIYVVNIQSQMETSGAGRSVGWRLKKNGVVQWQDTAYSCAYAMELKTFVIHIEADGGDALTAEYYSSAGPLSFRALIGISCVGRS